MADVIEVSPDATDQEIEDAITEAIAPLSPDEQHEQKTRIKRARAKLYKLDSPDEAFLAHLCTVPDRYSDAIPYAATNGEWIVWNLKGVKSLTDEQVYGVLLHEMLHIGLLHITLAKNYPDQLRFNIAADLAINSLVLKIEKADLPKGVCIAGKDDYEDLPEYETTEKYYALLEDKIDELRGKYGGGGEGATGMGQDVVPAGQELDENGKPVPGSEGSRMKRATLEERIKAAARRALDKAKGQGSMTATLQQQIEAATEPKIDYRRIVRMHATRLVRGGSDWSRPNRRLKAVGVNAARNRKRTVGDIAVVLDVSGSMGDNTMSQALADIRSIFKLTGARLHVIQHDVQVVSHDVFDGKMPTFTRNACGGTSHVPVFEYIDNHDMRPDLIICFSDLWTTYPDKEPNCRTVWVATEAVSEGNHPPFGELCHWVDNN